MSRKMDQVQLKEGKLAPQKIKGCRKKEAGKGKRARVYIKKMRDEGKTRWMQKRKKRCQNDQGQSGILKKGGSRADWERRNAKKIKDRQIKGNTEGQHQETTPRDNTKGQ
jgi:hypothetical protein